MLKKCWWCSAAVVLGSVVQLSAVPQQRGCLRDQAGYSDVFCPYSNNPESFMAFWVSEIQAAPGMQPRAAHQEQAGRGRDGSQALPQLLSQPGPSILLLLEELAQQQSLSKPQNSPGPWEPLSFAAQSRTFEQLFPLWQKIQIMKRNSHVWQEKLSAQQEEILSSLTILLKCSFLQTDSFPVTVLVAAPFPLGFPALFPIKSCKNCARILACAFTFPSSLLSHPFYPWIASLIPLTQPPQNILSPMRFLLVLCLQHLGQAYSVRKATKLFGIWRVELCSPWIKLI